MARFSARVLNETTLGSMSMREIYQNPSIRQLASALGTRVSGTAALRPGEHAAPNSTATVVRTSNALYLMTGALQLLIFLAVTYIGALLLDVGFTWAAAGATPLAVFERSSVYTAALFLLACVLPILAKWILVGRWKERDIRLWEPGLPALLDGQDADQGQPAGAVRRIPIYVLYLRALGAKIGRGATILSTTVPVATDLITIGAGTLIRRGVSFTGYHAVNGYLRTGRVTLGRDVFVGETSVLDTATTMGDDAQLGHSSSLHTGQVVPAGKTWHGVPAERPTPTTGWSTRSGCVPRGGSSSARRSCWPR